MIIFNGEAYEPPEVRLDEGAKIEDVLNEEGWKIINSFPIPKCQIKLEDIRGNEEKLIEYKGINYIYHEKWVNNDTLNPYIWVDKFVRWEKNNGIIA